MKTIIVTGSNGMLGSALQRMVQRRIEKDVTFKQMFRFVWTNRSTLDLQNESHIRSCLSQYDREHTIVVNLAADVGGLFKNMNGNKKIFENNLSINFNLLKVCSDLGIKKVINILSTCIFPDVTKYPLIEEQLEHGKPHASNRGYSYAKRLGGIYISLINDSDETNRYINLIPTNLFGKNDNYNIQDAHVIPGIIHKCYRAITQADVNTRPVVVDLPGDGRAERMFVYDEDLANIIIDCCCIPELQDCKGDYIISGEIEHSRTIRQVAEAISSILSDTIQIRFEQNEDNNGQNKKPCLNQKIKNEYARIHREYPVCDLQWNRNLKCVIDWFIQNYTSQNIRL